jgi:hypothetical protein
MAKKILTMLDSGTYQPDKNDLINNLLEGAGKTLILSLNYTPNHLINHLDSELVSETQDTLYILDCVSPEAPNTPNTIYIEANPSTIKIITHLKEALASIKPEYLIIDSLDKIDNMTTEDEGKEFMQEIIGEADKQGTNTLIFAGEDKESTPLVHEVKKHMDETKYYNKIKGESKIWKDYQQE